MIHHFLLRLIMSFIFISHLLACTPSSSSPPQKKRSSLNSKVDHLKRTQSKEMSKANHVQTSKALPTSDLIEQARVQLKSDNIDYLESSLKWTQVGKQWVGWALTPKHLLFITSPTALQESKRASSQKARLTIKKSVLPVECIDSELCDQWQSTLTFPQNCSQPLIGIRFRYTFTQDTGSKIRLLLYAPFQHSTPLNPIWQDDLRFEQTPTAHSESLFKKTEFINQQQAVKESEVELTPYLKQDSSQKEDLKCAPIFTLSRQSARSFNRVDARETEFDGVDQEVQLFLYKEGKYQRIELDDEIKIRPF